jgi:hypothetical protein
VICLNLALSREKDIKRVLYILCHASLLFILLVMSFFYPYYLRMSICHTRFFEENQMHLICVPESQFNTYDRLMSVISQNIAQNIQKRIINFYYTHDGRHEGLYTNNDNYEDTTSSSSSSSTGF